MSKQLSYLVAVDFVNSQNQLSVALTLMWPSGPVMLGDISYKYI